MTDREKLIALYKQWWETPFDEEECEDCTEDASRCNECLYGKFADYLLSTGVVVREKGEWIPVEPFANVWRCTACGEDYDMEDDAIPMTWGINFCPSCGADLRGEQHEP